MRRSSTKIVLALLLALLASVPILFSYAGVLLPSGSLFGTPAETGIPLSDMLQYTAIAIQDANSGNYSQSLLLLQYGIQHGLSPTTSGQPRGKPGEYQSAYSQLGIRATTSAPTNASNLRDYLAALRGSISSLSSIDTNLSQLQNLTSSGSINLAKQTAANVNVLIEDASKNITSATTALNRLQANGVNVSTQRSLIQILSSKLQQDKHTLAQLDSTTLGFERATNTQLSVTATPVPVFADQTLHISVRLRSEGTGLSNRTVQIWINGNATNAVTGNMGTATWNYHLSGSSHSNTVVIYASYSPTGSDAATLRPAKSASVIIPIEYYPASLTVGTDISNVHVEQNFTISGTLTGLSGIGLQNRTLQLLTDGIPTGTMMTDQAGHYSIVYSIPYGGLAGPHRIEVAFTPENDIYEQASKETAVEVYYLQPSLQVIQNQSTVLSGQQLAIEGTATIDSKAVENGLIIAYMGQQELGRSFTDSAGRFHLSMNVPLESTGQNLVRVVYVPNQPWINDGITYLVINVWNSALIPIGLGIFALAGIVLRRPSVLLRSKMESELILTGEAGAKNKKVNELLPSHLLFLEKIVDPSVRVREAYWKTREIIASALNDPGRRSESVREYATRIAAGLGKSAIWFSTLTHFFEIAEYSSNLISNDDAQQAVNNTETIANYVASSFASSNEASS